MVALAGFLASLVDGALGMGFGPTSSTILLSTGLSPAAASTTVNLAKVATGIAAAISHWRFRNIDHRLVLTLAIPGAVGAIIGVTVLSNVDSATIKPILAGLLILVGLRILLRFSRPILSGSHPGPDGNDLAHDPDHMPDFNGRGVGIAATAGGITNGLIGAWGPIVTPYLLHKRLPPRFAVGSVNTAEVAVAAVSAGALLGALGKGDVSPSVVAAMLVGGVIAAPISAYVVRLIPPRPLGLAVAALLLLTNTRELADWAGLGAVRWAAYGGALVLTAAAALYPRLSGAPAPDTTDATDAAEPAAGPTLGPRPAIDPTI
jgi:uncharacterized protein